MSVSSITYPVSGQWEVTHPLQYFVEGTTPATFGVTPTSSPVGVLAGAMQDISDTPVSESFIKRTIGKREFYKNLLTKHKVTFELKFAPYNVTLMKYGSEPANAAGTIAESLTFLKGVRFNSAGSLAQHWILFKGCRMASLDISVAGKEVEVSSAWVAQRKIPIATTHGLTTPDLRTFADLTATPWVHLDNGTNPLTLDGVTYPCVQFHCNWNNNLAVDDDVNGDEWISQSTQGNRVITGDFTLIVGKDTKLETAMAANPLPAWTGSYVLKAATATINFTELSVKQATDGFSSEDNKTWRIPYTFEAKNALIA